MTQVDAIRMTLLGSALTLSMARLMIMPIPASLDRLLAGCIVIEYVSFLAGIL
jgi:hypothetical protein